MAETRPRALVLHDAAALTGRPDAADVLSEAAHIARALAALDFAALVLPVTLDLATFERELERLSPQVVVNLVESLEGRGELIHVVPALLERHGVAFTGCGAATLALTSNKPAAKEFLAAAGVRVPPRFGAGAPSETRWIVKSCWEHASLGLDDASIVPGAEVAALIARRTAKFGGDWFAERYIAGRELNVGLIGAPDGVRVLPVAEIRFEDFPTGKPHIVGYAAKWDTASLEYQRTVRSFALEPPECAAAGAAALECWRLVGARGYARVDFRVDAAGALWVLEVNANPCLSPDAGFAAMLAEAGIESSAALEWLLAAAAKARRGAPEH